MGGLGSLARYGLTELVEHKVGKAFPYGTMSVNLLGCLLFGMVWASVGKGWITEEMKLVLLVGFLSGFTTFSSFSAESLGLLQRGDLGLALLHSAAHLLGALACAAAGFALARWLLRG